MALGATLVFGCLSAGAQVSFYTAVDLALRNSSEVHMGEAEVARAASGLAQTRDAYKPNLGLGSSVGYSFGFPLGQPSIVNVTSQSLLFSFSQPDYIRSAHASLDAAQHSLQDTRQRIVTETALDYIEIDADAQELAALEQQHEDGEQLVKIEEDRVSAGVDSRIDLTQAELRNAQLELRRLHLDDHQAVLLARLGHLTGLNPQDIVTQASSVPPFPDFTRSVSSEVAIRNNYGVQAATDAAKSKQYVAFGDNRQVRRPEFDFGLQYSRFATFNNYATYYRNFQPDNFGIAINITLPLLDAARREKARGSAADAVRARAETSHLRDQVSEQLLELQKSLSELAAQQKVARLQNDLAREQLAVITTQLQNGSGSPNATPVTPRDAEGAKIEERQRYTELLDANLQLAQAQLNLLRALGQTEEWARQLPK